MALLDLYGIGPASVWYVLFDVYHQWDELNHISPWEQKIYSKLFFDQGPEEPVAVDDEQMNVEEEAPARSVGELSDEEIVLAELNETWVEKWC